MKINLSGKKFGTLTVLEEAPRKISPCGHPHRMWLCKCKCGKEVIVRQSHLKNQKSCSRICEYNGLFINNIRNTKHGMYGSRLYRIWTYINGICYNENYPGFKRFGNAGICVCEEWRHDSTKFIKWALENGYTDDSTLCVNYNTNFDPNNCSFKNGKRYLEVVGNDPVEVEVHTKTRKHKYTEQQKQKAMDYFFSHGNNLTATVKELGYPCTPLLRKWVFEITPDCRLGITKRSTHHRNQSLTREKRSANRSRFTQEQKRQAVLELCSHTIPVRDIADKYKVTRQAIYLWKNEFEK